MSSEFAIIPGRLIYFWHGIIVMRLFGYRRRCDGEEVDDGRRTWEGWWVSDYGFISGLTIPGKIFWVVSSGRYLLLGLGLKSRLQIGSNSEVVLPLLIFAAVAVLLAIAMRCTGMRSCHSRALIVGVIIALLTYDKHMLLILATAYFIMAFVAALLTALGGSYGSFLAKPLYRVHSMVTGYGLFTALFALALLKVSRCVDDYEFNTHIRVSERFWI